MQGGLSLCPALRAPRPTSLLEKLGGGQAEGPAQAPQTLYCPKDSLTSWCYWASTGAPGPLEHLTSSFRAT